MNVDVTDPQWTLMNQGLYDEFGHEWNDGDGRTRDGGGVSQTSSTGALSSAQFNSGS